MQYRVVGRCPQCASEVVLLDAADRLPLHHTAKGKAVCSFQGDPVRVRRISEPPPARTSTSPRKLSRKQAKRAKQRAIQAVIRAGNERLYGALHTCATVRRPAAVPSAEASNSLGEVQLRSWNKRDKHPDAAAAVEAMRLAISNRTRTYRMAWPPANA